MKNIEHLRAQFTFAVQTIKQLQQHFLYFTYIYKYDLLYGPYDVTAGTTINPLFIVKKVQLSNEEIAETLHVHVED